MTTEAYCIIEQGKVDALLQSSPRDRRVIFEEAAGISQFKAKKAVALRRMERVEQNLLRLSDIVDEVESRLRSIRSQAGKARRYRECTERLQQLRTEVALVDWRQFTKQIDDPRKRNSPSSSCASTTARLPSKQATPPHWNSSPARSGSRRNTSDRSRRPRPTREQIAALQATVESQRARQAELQDEILRIRDQLVAMDTQDDHGRRFLPRCNAEAASRRGRADRSHRRVRNADRARDSSKGRTR